MQAKIILIGTVHSRNGIAAWCIEAARALLVAGHNTWVIATGYHCLPHDLHPYAIILPAPAPRSFMQKLNGRINWWGQFFLSPTFDNSSIAYGYKVLCEREIHPDLLLLSQTDFLWPEAPVQQWVVARAWPIDVKGYLAKMQQFKSQPWLPRLHDLIFWYKIDHKAYRYATGVLALTKRLADNLVQAGYHANTLYPCIAKGIEEIDISHPKEKIIPKLLTAALQLGDKRKNIAWMLQALATLKPQNITYELTLVGEYDEELANTFRQWIPQVVFTGPLARPELLGLMKEHDIFLFASHQENWGYVLIEAMSQGMAIFTPDMYPFDEINPFDTCRFIPDNINSFVGKLITLIDEKEKLKKQRQANLLHYTSHFSGSAFAKKIESLLLS